MLASNNSKSNPNLYILDQKWLLEQSYVAMIHRKTNRRLSLSHTVLLTRLLQILIPASICRIPEKCGNRKTIWWCRKQEIRNNYILLYISLLITFNQILSKNGLCHFSYCKWELNLFCYPNVRNISIRNHNHNFSLN